MYWRLEVFMSKKNNRSSSKRTMLIVLCALLSLILLLLVLGTVYLEYMMNLIGRVEDNGNTTMSSEEYEQWLQNQTETLDPDFTGEVLDPTDITWGEVTEPVEQGENIINILLIGQDRREGEGRARSDAMILCTINKAAKTLTMTSFMRDMYVQIPGYHDNRINASYELGGMKLLDACLEKNFGIQVDGNVEVDFTRFMEIIDMLGGVDMELTSAEANYLNNRGNWDVNDSTAGQWNLKAGKNHLTGEQALAYSRIRYVGNGDFGRTERQRKVLNALLEKAKGLTVLELNNLLQKMLPMLTTDMSNAQILGYALELFPMLTELEMVTQRVPADGTYSDAVINGMMVLKVDLEANRKLLQNCMREQ